LKKYRQRCEEAFEVPEDKMIVEDVAKYLDVADVTVISWIRKGILHKNGNIQNGFLLDRKKVEALAETRKKGPQLFTDAQGTWYLERSAEEKYPNAKGYMLRRYRNKPCPQLNRDILHAQRIPWQVGMKKSRHGRPWAYLDKDLERLTPAEPGENFLRNWWTKQEAGRYGHDTLKSANPNSESNSNDLITGKEACALSGILPSALSKICRPGGPIYYERKGRRLKVSAKSLAEYVSERGRI